MEIVATAAEILDESQRNAVIIHGVVAHRGIREHYRVTVQEMERGLQVHLRDGLGRRVVFQAQRPVRIGNKVRALEYALHHPAPDRTYHLGKRPGGGI